MLDDCVSYLDGTIFNIQSKITDFDELSQDLDSIIVKDEVTNAMNGNNMNQNQPLTEEISRKLTMSSKFQKLRYLSRLHLQLGAVLSQINKHEEALHHGKTAALYCQDLIKNTELLCNDYLERINQTHQKENIKKKYLNSPVKRLDPKKNISNNFKQEHSKNNSNKAKISLPGDDNKIEKLHKFESKEKSNKSPK